MNRHFRVFGLLIPGVLLLSGCHCFQSRFEPSVCNPTRDCILGSCYECGSCGGACEGHTPCSYAKHTLTCASGCDEIYWGEWISDPPATCDPCDNCGNWTGTQCCESVWSQLCAGWHTFWGYNMCGRGDWGCRMGTAYCGVESGMYDPLMGEVIHEGEVIYEGEVVSPALPLEVTPEVESPEEMDSPVPVPDGQTRVMPSTRPHWRSSPIRSMRSGP
jgi:hypothetical protein